MKNKRKSYHINRKMYCIADGKLELQNLFKFVHENAESMQAYEMELNILCLVQKIGLTAMQCYFAEKGTGEIVSNLSLENGTILKKRKSSLWDAIHTYCKSSLIF